MVTGPVAVYKLLEMAPTTMRFLFNMNAPESLDQAKALYERLRERCPRTECVEV
jgi:hypothetical protein